jgi:uncharacterized protein (DUF2147 family)
MKKLYLLVALLMASTAAHAGNAVSLQIGGHKIRIEAPKNCDKLSCLQVSAPSLSGSDLFKGLKSGRDDDDVASRADPPPQKAAAAPVDQAAAPRPVAAERSAPSASKEVASTSAAPVSENIASVASPAAPNEPAIAAAPVQAPTPLGVWNTEKNKGMVRIEQCGQNLCGYAVPNGERILVNMKPSDKKWTGRIHDPDSGKTYDSTIAMKGPNILRVQGCVFGGIFCGGQTWNRVS